MAASLVKTLRAAGVDPEGIELVSRAHALAMGPRVRQLPDQDHPLYLHPGRSALVLLRDAGMHDPVLLAAAVLAESEDEELAVDPDALPAMTRRDEGARRAADLVKQLPRSGSDRLAEDLLAAPDEARLVALAERLDHLRHAHLRGDPTWRRRVHDEALRVYGPVAERTHEGLARRYRYWCGMFGRRYLKG